MKHTYLAIFAACLSQAVCLASDFVHLEGTKVRDSLAKIATLGSGKISKAEVARIFEITSFGEIVASDQESYDHQIKIDDNYNLMVSFWEYNDELALLSIVDLEATKKQKLKSYLPLRWNSSSGSYFCFDEIVEDEATPGDDK